MAERRSRTAQTASHWGVYRVEVDDDTHEVLSVSPVTRDREPTPLRNALPETVHDRLRIDRPHVREGYLRSRGASRADRGADAFVPVDWDTALTLAGDALLEAREEHGNESVYGGSYGWASAGRLHHAPSVLKRFLGMFGGYTDKCGNHSFGAALGVMPYVLGSADINGMVTRWPEVVAHTRLMVMFGGSAARNSQVDPGGLVSHETGTWTGRARAAGVETVGIGPQRSDLPPGAEWVPIRPNTDVAVMLGLAHTLVVEGLVDRRFVDAYCAGYPEFEAYLLGRPDGTPKDAAWAAGLSGAPAEVIVGLARRMAATRTLVTTAWAVQRAQHGEQPVWATVALASMLGQIGLPGGGFNLGFGAVGGGALPRADDIPRPTLSLGTNPVAQKVPVGRVTEMLLRPGETLEYDGREIRLPRAEVVWSAGGNPFHHNLDLNRFLAGWQQPATVVVSEPWWSPPARFADIVLPSTTTMERNDLAATENSRFWTPMHQVVPPVAQARNDLDVFAELADRLGFGERYHEGRDERGWLEHLYEVARATARERGYDPPDFAAFWAGDGYEFPLRTPTPPLFAAFREDPRTHPLDTDSGRIELVSERIRSYGYDDCPAHPSWLEPAEWLGGAGAVRHPLHLLTHQPAHRLHSQLDQSSVSRGAQVGGRETILVTPDDAARRGLDAGDVARVFNDRGAFLAVVRLAEPGTLVAGVVAVATGAWYDPEVPGRAGSLEKHGNPNVVTSDRGSSRLTQCSAAQTCLVEIERYDDPPPVTAFDAPRVVTPAGVPTPPGRAPAGRARG